MSIPELMRVPCPQVRADLAGAVAAIVAARRSITAYHDVVLGEQATAAADSAGRMEQTQQTAAALVREIGTLLEQARKVQAIGDQLDRVLNDLRSAA